MGQKKETSGRKKLFPAKRGGKGEEKKLSLLEYRNRALITETRRREKSSGGGRGKNKKKHNLGEKGKRKWHHFLFGRAMRKEAVSRSKGERERS